MEIQNRLNTFIWVVWIYVLSDFLKQEMVFHCYKTCDGRIDYISDSKINLKLCLASKRNNFNFFLSKSFIVTPVYCSKATTKTLEEGLPELAKYPPVNIMKPNLMWSDKLRDFLRWNSELTRKATYHYNSLGMILWLIDVLSQFRIEQDHNWRGKYFWYL